MEKIAATTMTRRVRTRAGALTAPAAPIRKRIKRRARTGSAVMPRNTSEFSHSCMSVASCRH